MSYRASAGKNGAWTRPVTRMYSYNFQVGENYYHPMTTYLDTKYTDINVPLDIPGALSFSERLARRWPTGRTDYAAQVENSSSSYMTHTAYGRTPAL